MPLPLPSRKVLKLANRTPDLRRPRPASRIRLSRNDAKTETIASYFATQPKAYVQELDQWIAFNGLPERRLSLLAHVSCFNEEENISNLHSQYEKQTLLQESETDQLVCMVVNSPTPGLTDLDELRFLRTIELILALTDSCPWFHLLAKQFPSGVAGLGRARKYGLDYCLRVAQLTQSPNAVIVANEGDTVWLPAGYLAEHWESLQKGQAVLSQGTISYPEFAHKSPGVDLFLQTREAVHQGQGLAIEELPSFGGIMPIGRNFSVLAWAAAVVGGVDPTRRTGTDDDIVFGHQISRQFGATAKQLVEIQLVTNPRREVRIVDAICSGCYTDAKESYESFHDDVSVYDECYKDVQERCARLRKIQLSASLRAMLCRQYFQWVHRSVMREVILNEETYAFMSTRYGRHEVGYWDLEDCVLPAYIARLESCCRATREQIVSHHLRQAFTLFNQFCTNIAAVPTDLPDSWIPQDLAAV